MPKSKNDLKNNRTKLNDLPLNWNESFTPRVTVDTIYEIFKELTNDKEYVLLQNIKEPDAHALIERIKLNNLQLFYSKSKLIIKKIPRSWIHENASGKIYHQLRRTLTNVISIGQADCLIGSIIKEPDASLVPEDRNTLGPYSNDKKREFPTVVVEVAFTHESEKMLLNELRRWLSNLTTVMVAIGVKIKIKETVSIKFYLFERNKEEHYIKRDLSEGVEYEDNDYYIVKIPLVAIYNGSKIPDHLKEIESVSLDLLDLKNSMIISYYDSLKS